jgi:serine/threonine-protein kinase
MNPNDATRVSDEKARLYQSAHEAWEKGDLTSALGKMEELAAMEHDSPEPDPGRSSTYRNFYIQVHAEQDALKNSYEEARRNLAAGNLEAALAACWQNLVKYPNHPLFEALEADVEERQRQNLPHIAEIDRRVEQEPDLGRRVGILEEALKQYPGELHFEHALQAARDKSDLVNSVVAEARSFEERGQFSDALDQWQILKAIHDKQPGLELEIQRLINRRDQPANAAAKSPWVEQANQYLDGGDYQRALQSVAIGLAESPGSPELLALDEQLHQRQERATRALDLLGKAHESSDKGAPDDALAALREAHNLDSRNSVIRTVLVNSLVEQASRVVDSDWRSAEELVREVLRLDPNNAPARSLVSRIAERMAAPQPAGIAPSEPGTPPNLPPMPPPPAAPPPIAPPPTALPPTAPPTVSLREDPTVAVPASLTQALFNLPVPKEPALPAPAAQTPAPQKTAPVPPTAGHTKKLLLGTGAVVVLLVLIALGVTLSHHPKKAPPAAKYAIVVHSTPEGAEIKINGNSCGLSRCSQELPPGSYQAEAQLTGYQNATISFTVGPGAPTDISLTLTPQGPRVTIFTDLTDGTVSLDDAPAGQIQGGGAEIANLSPGKHVLSVKGGDSTASIPVEISLGAAPTLAGSIDATNLRCFVVAGYGGEAHLYGNGTGYRVTLDGKPVGGLTADGMPLQGLTPGTHELALDSATGQHDRIVFESQPSASLYVSLEASQNLGWLSVETNEDQAHLFINGEKYKRDTARGRLVVYLFPKKYTVTVQKDGFAPTAQQTVDIKRGEETKVSFTLTPAKGILAIHHAPPGTDVLVDNISRGTTHPDGEFQVGGIEPGRHTVTLRHDGFKPLQTEQTFAGGKTVDLQGALEAAPVTGTLRFDIGPPGLDAHVRIRRDGDAQDHEVTGPSVSLPEGHYIVSVSAPQYATATAAVQVTAGSTAVAAVTLRHLEAAKAPAKAAPAGFGLEDWLKTGGWVQQPGMITHKGGDWVMAPLDIAQGTIRFTVVSLKGRHVEWVVADRDEKNFLHYELDDKNLTRYEVRNGSKSGQVKVAHGLDKKKPMGISLAITPQSVVISVLRGGWLDLDKWDVVGSAVHGRFGFRIPGSDEIGLQDFQITPN